MGEFVMQQAKVKKVTSRLLVVLLTLAMAFDYNIAMAYAASNITLPENQYLVSQTDNNIAPGIKESHIVSNDKTGNRQNMDYVCEVNIKNTKTTKIIAGYNNYNGNSWGMQSVRDQAKAAEKATKSCSFGGGCINDVVIHLATSQMGFGGFGESGMGSYHGKAGFETFTHYKSIVDKKTWMDLPVRYQPYRKSSEKLLKLFLR